MGSTTCLRSWLQLGRSFRNISLPTCRKFLFLLRLYLNPFLGSGFHDTIQARSCKVSILPPSSNASLFPSYLIPLPFFRGCSQPPLQTVKSLPVTFLSTRGNCSARFSPLCGFPFFSAVRCVGWTPKNYFFFRPKATGWHSFSSSSIRVCAYPSRPLLCLGLLKVDCHC